MHIDACSYIVSDPCCLLYYDSFFLLGMSVVGKKKKKKGASPALSANHLTDLKHLEQS